MKLNKTFFLNEVRNQGISFNFHSLMKNIHAKYEQLPSEKTLRRWLQELERQGIVQKKGGPRSGNYVFFMNKKAISHNGSFFEEHNFSSIAYITQPIHKREPVVYQHHFLQSYEPNLTFYLSPEIRRDLMLAGKRLVKQLPAATLAKKIYNRLLIDLSYNSSRLEGNTYSLLDTERLLLLNHEAEGKLEHEKVMILNHKEAIRYIVDKASSIHIENDTIFSIHYLLSDGLVFPELSGVVRNEGVLITGSTYTPMESKKEIETTLSKILDKAKNIDNPFEKSFFLLIHLSYLQGFIDVNKRTARLASNIPLIKDNLIPLSFNGINKNDYSLAIIAFYETLDVSPFAELYKDSYITTAATYEMNVQGQEFDIIYATYRSERRKLLAEIIQKLYVGEAMKDFINQKTVEFITIKEDREKFIEHTLKDIDLLEMHRIVGLGVSREEYLEWKKMKEPS